jgi:hypothetical protein
MHIGINTNHKQVSRITLRRSTGVWKSSKKEWLCSRSDSANCFPYALNSAKTFSSMGFLFTTAMERRIFSASGTRPFASNHRPDSGINLQVKTINFRFASVIEIAPWSQEGDAHRQGRNHTEQSPVPQHVGEPRQRDQAKGEE